MAAKKKGAKKKGKPAIPTRPGKFGGQLRTGNPGNKGGSGRPPNWLREWCDELLADPKSKEQVEQILANKDHPGFASMWAKVADRAHGRPKETVEHTGEVQHQHAGSIEWGGVKIQL